MNPHNRIFYLCPDFNSAAGGVKVMYKHAEILYKNGYNAFVLHGKTGFKCTWFESDCPIVYISKVKLTDKDIVVLPEIFFHLSSNANHTIRDYWRWYRGQKTDYFAAKAVWQSPCKKIIFNQNAYHTFLDFSLEYPYSGHLFQYPVAFFSISEHNKRYLSFALPDVPIFTVQWSLNQHIFHHHLPKKRQICYMTRKNPQHVKQVISILTHRNRLGDFTLKAIENMSESQVAHTMQESMLYLSFGYPEGLPLPPAEALACGCLVIGYNGGGGQDYFKPPYCFDIPFGEIIYFVEKVEQLCHDLQAEVLDFNALSATASHAILHTYTAKNEEDTLLNAWQQLQI